MDEYLYKSDSISKPKMKINCKDTNNQTTKGWLENLTLLKTINKAKSFQMPNKKILEAIFMSKKEVVVKIGNEREDIQKEFTMFEILDNHNIPGISHYFCYFECAGNLSKIKESQKDICDGTGTGLRVLVMEYIKQGSLADYNWTLKQKDILKSCLKQVVLTHYTAFMKCGFIHGDRVTAFHCNNILLKKTNSTKIKYIDDFEVDIPKNGFKVKLMDFEFSRINGSLVDYYKDLLYGLGSSLHRHILPKIDKHTDSSIFLEILAYITKLYEQANPTENPKNSVTKLLTLIDQI